MKIKKIENPIEEKIKQLENKIDLMSFLCSEINPFIPLSEENKKILIKLKIDIHLNPFELTNQLIKIHEDLIQELHIIKPLNIDFLEKENLK